MKKSMNKVLKIILIAALISIICIISYLLYDEIKHPEIQEEKVSLFTYNTSSNIDYEVLSKPNILYGQGVLTAEDIYLTEFIDSINSIFTYNFEGESIGDIKGEYEIIATVEGYIREQEKEKSIWKKEFILSPRTSFEAKDRSISIIKDIKINLVEYNNFAKQVMEESKVNSDTRLTVLMNVLLKNTTDVGVIEEMMSPAMVIPLNANYFSITKDQVQEKPGVIEETREVQLPVNRNIIIVYSIALGVLCISLLCLIFLTTGTVKDSFTKALDKIFKKHGSRLVALNSNIPGSFKDYNKVKAIDDLVRIADEIGKPIMYKYSADPKEIIQFYVWDENQLFIFDLKEAVKKMEMEKPQEPIKKPKVKGEKNKKGVPGQDNVVLNNSK